jgi:multiple RNA-binding domain-containing protein 1
LAYRKYQDEPLYLEWAPDNCFVKDDNDPVQDDDMDEEPDTVEAAAPSQIKSNKAVEETEETDDLDADATEAVPSGKTAKRDATEVLRGVDSDDEQDDGEPTSTLFVKNLNFETPEETLRNAFEGIGPLRYTC